MRYDFEEEARPPASAEGSIILLIRGASLFVEVVFSVLRIDNL